jgi:hypothetical protein
VRCVNKEILFCVCAIALSCSSSSGKPDAGTTCKAGSSGQAGTVGTAGTGSTTPAGTGGAGTTGSGGAGTTGSGGAGTTGSSGNTGTAGAVATSACGKLLPLQTSESVLLRGKNVQRTAHFVEAALTTTAVSAKFGPDATFNAAGKFMGALEGTPLFVAGSTPGKGMYIVASHNNGNSILTAIDETAGTTLWSHVLGASGNGVRSTPVIDATKGIVYTAFDASTGGTHFEIHASSIANMGAEVTGWPVNASMVKTLTGDMLSNFDPGKEIQRGALTLVNGVLYVPFGGVYGDGPPYKGIVIAVNAADPTQTGGWSASGDRSGLWQGGGLASDGTSIFGTTSNGSDGTHMDSEELVRITGMGTSSHTAKDAFFPSSWKTWDGQDNDFGSSSPLVLQFSGGCQSMVVSPSKPGHLFFMDPANLGGADGSTPLRDLLLGTNASPSGEYKVFYAAPTAYISASGVHLALEARVDAACPTPGGDQLVSVQVDMSTTPPTPKVAWCAPVQGGEDRHSPISTTVDGVSSAIVWFVYNSSLYAYDGDKGTQLFAGNPCGNVEKQTAPIAADGHVVVGADGKLCSYSVQP